RRTRRAPAARPRGPRRCSIRWSARCCRGGGSPRPSRAGAAADAAAPVRSRGPAPGSCAGPAPGPPARRGVPGRDPPTAGHRCGDHGRASSEAARHDRAHRGHGCRRRTSAPAPAAGPRRGRSAPRGRAARRGRGCCGAPRPRRHCRRWRRRLRSRRPGARRDRSGRSRRRCRCRSRPGGGASCRQRTTTVGRGAWCGGLGCGRIGGRRAHCCSTTTCCARGCVRPRAVDPHAAAGRTVFSMTGTTVHEDLTVGRVADLVGVSVRTLHHWDAIGLVRPSGRTWSGYRLYDTEDVARIHRVLVYRELGLALAQIGAILDDPSADPREHLQRQRTLLQERIRRLERTARAVDEMIERTTMSENDTNIGLSPEEQARIFGTDWDPAYEEEARGRWGGTDAWAQSAARTREWGTARWQEIGEEVDEVETALADALARGVAPGSEEAGRLAERHRATISRHYE